MYLRILKKDIRRKKTMNIILLLFVILAATFIASSANNLITVSQALDGFFAAAGAPDHWFAATDRDDIVKFEKFAKENGYDYYVARLIQIEPKNVLVEGKKLAYSNTLTLSTLGDVKIFDKNNREIKEINDGEVYVTYEIFCSVENDFHEGAKILVKQGELEKEFTVKGYTKDVLFGSQMVGMTRFLISENDAALFDNAQAAVCSSVGIHTNDPDFADKFNRLETNNVFYADRSMMEMLYFMDVLMAAILLVVSICLILIAMVILRFIIHFTIAEEYREIGVMKAIGIKSGKIRSLYIAKYLVVSAIGSVAGFVFSIPFCRLMIGQVSKKIILSGGNHFWINFAAAFFAGMVVVLFSYFCTRRIRKFSPIDAIRSGESGERFREKTILHLGKSRLPVPFFMALNDILSGVKSYISMTVIFILGTLLVIIPMNTINTLRSDHLITLFNMVESDHVISKELLFRPGDNHKANINEELSKIREILDDNGISADVFQEILFRCNVTKDGKVTNSLAFQGVGDVTCDMYTYIEGSAPANAHEVALTYITAGRVDAKIGDDVKIKMGGTTKTYIVTAITQSMNNMGEGVRFYQTEELDYDYAAGSFGIQVNYKDAPDAATLAKRGEILGSAYPDAKIYTAGGYISYMIGDIAAQLDGMKIMILTIILGINMLVAVLMIKSFITKEKHEIALQKAIGFQDKSLVLVQTLRIGIVLLISVLTGILISAPLSKLIITPIFQMMGAYQIKFEIRVLEVYLVFPLLMLTATATAAFLSAQGLRKITSAEISGVE